MDVAERREVAKKKGICFKCLRKGHLVSECRSSGPSLLFKNIPKQTASSPSNAEIPIENRTTDIHGENLHTPVVQVLIHSKEDPSTYIRTYALLDSQSNACFITDNLAKKLNVKMQPVSLKVTTVLDRNQVIDSQALQGLIVKGINEKTEVPLPATYTRSDIPVSGHVIPKQEHIGQWPHLKEIVHSLAEYDQNIEVGLLIGVNCSAALRPLKVAAAGDEEPYAVKTVLGWGIIGDLSKGKKSSTTMKSHFAFRTITQEVSPLKVQQMFEQEFIEQKCDHKMSVEDQCFMQQMESNYQQVDGHYELPLPVKEETNLPNNRKLALKRLHSLRGKLKKNKQYRDDYVAFMRNNIDKGYAEKIPEDELQGNNGKVWYIPHQGVYHPKKPNKIRVVFDCSAEYEGQVLNKQLLSGPDLNNNLTGVLLRFRQEEIAITCDVEGMFHQVFVKPNQRDFLRFLWFEDDDFDKDPVEYRMTVHLFGATSSPACASFALKKTADQYETECGQMAAEFMRDNFYVDDGLKSVATIDEAVTLMESSHTLCKKGGFNLHKYVCSNKEALSRIPKQLQDKNIQLLDLSCDHLPVSRTLGVEWNVEEDVFQFKIQFKNKTTTRREMLSTISSVYDPLGLIAPAFLTGRKILQDLCKDSCSWDDEVTEEMKMSWESWLKDISQLTGTKIQRCYKPKGFGKPQTVELHHFADASLRGYGECSYLRLLNENGSASSTLIMSKSRVTPSKPITVPRLELTAAVLAARIAHFLEQELDYSGIKHFFWIDSKVVLGYIRNESRRFHMYVANRVQRIRDLTHVEDWNYIDTMSNPADLASRGLTAEGIQNSDVWWHGPAFLTSSQPLPENKENVLNPDDSEIRNLTVHATNSVNNRCFNLCERLAYFSDWHRACKAIANCLRLQQRFAQPETRKMVNPMCVANMKRAEKEIIKAVQREAFSQERDVLQNLQKSQDLKRGERLQEKTVKRCSSLYRLAPFVDNDQLIRVGGRVKRANIPRDLAHPLILPKHSHVTTLLIRHFHPKTRHAGTNTTLNEIRACGYWIVQGRSAIASYVWSCVGCRKIRSGTACQRMSDLPVERLEPAPPFTYTGVDMFGPFYVKEGRSEQKRWGVLFTCLTMRAVHIEVARDLTTDSFINAYRRFVCRRGPIRTLRCDRGTNFVGAKNELRVALGEMDKSKVKSELLKEGCDMVDWSMNVPHASHMGGAWERMIRSVRNVLAGLLAHHSTQLNDELLRTFMTEAEAIVNSRPLTYQDCSPDSPEPLTPNQILTLKAKVVFPPPGNFVKEDLYCRRCWRRVQYLANQFWTRWRKEVLPMLQERPKWNSLKNNILCGDVVLMVEDNVARNHWPLGIITKTFPSADGLVRKVCVKTALSRLERPITKIVLIYRPESPTREP